MSKIPQPKSLEVKKNDSSLTISWRYNVFVSVLAFVFSCGFVAVSIGMTIFFVDEIYGKVKGGSFYIVLGINLVFAIVSLIFFFYALAHVFNKYVIKVDRNKLYFLFKPIPSILTKKQKSLSVYDIEEIYVYPWQKPTNAKAGKMYTTLWHIHIYTNQGKEISGHFSNDLEEAMFMEQELRNFLNIKNTVRRGLYIDSDEYWNNGVPKSMSYVLRGQMKNTRIEILNQIDSKI